MTGTHPSQPIAMPASDWVCRWSHLIPAGSTVLDVACGRGRHMAFFKDRGCHPTGIDRDSAALSEAGHYGAVVQADIENHAWPLPAAQFDLVLVTNYLWRPLMHKLAQCVRPGGWLIYETFACGNETVGRPSNPDFLLNTGELLNTFSSFHVVAYENGFLQNPDRFVQRLCACRPNNAQTSLAAVQHPLLSVKCLNTTIAPL